MAVLEDRRNRVWFHCCVEDGTPLEWTLIDGFSLCSGLGESAGFIVLYEPEACCYSIPPFHMFLGKSLAVCLAGLKRQAAEGLGSSGTPHYVKNLVCRVQRFSVAMLVPP